MVSERIPVAKAAKMLGLSPQGVREHMKKNLFKPPIGHVIPKTEKKYEYLIYRDMLMRYMGKEIT